MNYEQKYKEALERAKKLHDSYNLMHISVDEIEQIFPELAESEDERIRKWLLDFAIGMIAGLELDISRSTYDGIKGHDPESKAELAQWQKARAYLEKQKDLTTENIYKHSRERMSFYNGQQKEQKPAEKSSMLKILKEHLANTPREQLDAEFEALKDLTIDKSAEWSEEDWKFLDEVREHIIGVIGDKPDLTPNKIYDGFLDLIDRLKFAKPQLKQEWSKEDKDVIDEAAELALGWGCPNLSAKLKSILSRVKPAEWSEEDEKTIDTIVSVLGQYIDYKAVSGTGSGYATPRYSKEINWLKSFFGLC